MRTCFGHVSRAYHQFTQAGHAIPIQHPLLDRIGWGVQPLIAGVWPETGDVLPVYGRRGAMSVAAVGMSAAATAGAGHADLRDGLRYRARRILSGAPRPVFNCV